MLAIAVTTVLVTAGCSDDESVTATSYYTVSGHVCRLDNGGSIPKVEVAIGDKSFRTGLSGYYELKRITPGTRTITAHKDCCYSAYEAELEVDGVLVHDIYLDPSTP